MGVLSRGGFVMWGFCHVGVLSVGFLSVGVLSCGGFVASPSIPARERHSFNHLAKVVDDTGRCVAQERKS